MGLGDYMMRDGNLPIAMDGDAGPTRLPFDETSQFIKTPHINWAISSRGGTLKVPQRIKYAGCGMTTCLRRLLPVQLSFPYP